MARIGLCKKQDCIKKDTCKRFLTTEGDDFNFYAICKEEDNYTWYWELSKFKEVK
ncbi:hypothetical protein [Clostridium tagluense]|uniref:Uncharacterized protein n=1 Tax=Clostridium tagluense TaxID=360422 RepID=A0A401UQC5_9CLOT|nr:hypothetical protein [Clostridium tagluense]GCD11763.1 hypothetical protein Ctaglu_33860 [Clostridium tagluense]